MNVQYVIEQLRFAVFCMESGNSKDALIAIELAETAIKDWDAGKNLKAARGQND